MAFRGSRLTLAHDARINGRRLGVKQCMSLPHPPLPDEGIVPQPSIVLVLDVLIVKRPLPFHIHPFEVFVEAR